MTWNMQISHISNLIEGAFVHFLSNSSTKSIVFFHFQPSADFLISTLSSRSLLKHIWHTVLQFLCTCSLKSIDCYSLKTRSTCKGTKTFATPSLWGVYIFLRNKGIKEKHIESCIFCIGCIILVYRIKYINWHKILYYQIIISILSYQLAEE